MDEAVNQKKQDEDRNELFMWACARGLLPDAMELVAGGADPSVTDKLGRRPIHYAAAHGHADVLRYLASHGVDTDADDAQGRTALHYAALGGHAAAVRVLVGKQGSCWVDAYDADGNTPLHLTAKGFVSFTTVASSSVLAAQAAAAAAKGMGGAGVGGPGEELLSEEERLLGSKVDAFTAAQQQQGSGAAIHALAAAGANLEDRNNQDLTPLGMAVVSNNEVAVAALLRCGARVAARAEGHSLLHLAAGLGHAQCMQRMLDGTLTRSSSSDLSVSSNTGSHPADVNACIEGLTPLHAAALAGSVACATVLLKHGADPTATTPQGLMPADLVPHPPHTYTTNDAAPPAHPPTADSDQQQGSGDVWAHTQELRAMLRSAAAAVLPTSSNNSSTKGGAALVNSVGNAAPAAHAALQEAASLSGGVDSQQQRGQEPAQPQRAGEKPPQQQQKGQQQGSGDPKLELLQQRFERMSEQDRVRKVDTYARMSEAEVAALPYMPPSVLPLIKQLKRAHCLLACWQPIAALRSDANLQEDLKDVRLRATIEELTKPGVDFSRFRLDSQIQSVLTKVMKLHSVLRENSQGLKVTLADLRAAPHGANSVQETNRQLHNLEARVAAAQQVVINHIMEGGQQEEREDRGGDSLDGCRSEDPTNKDEQLGVEKRAQGAGTSGLGAGKEIAAGHEQQQPGQDGLPTNGDMVQGGEAVSGREHEMSFGEHFRMAMALNLKLEEAKQGCIPSWGRVLMVLWKRLGWQLLRMFGMLLIMLVAMNMMGLMPDQMRAKALKNKEEQAAVVAAAQASGAELLLEGGPTTGSCRSGQCSNGKAQRNEMSYEQSFKEVQEQRRRAAEVRRLEALIEGGVKVELEGLDEAHKGDGHEQL